MKSPAPPASLARANSRNPNLSIAAVERETGLSKDTLRVWERRYGFPQPLRDESGDRRYSAGQVRRLKMISRLLDSGMRPGKVVRLGHAGLQSLLNASGPPAAGILSKTNAEGDLAHPMIGELLQAIATHDTRGLRHGLSSALLRMGLGPFVTALVAPLTMAVGDAWARGRIQIFEEHQYTEIVTGVLRHAMDSLNAQPVTQGPRVLLTTVPQEPHGIGLLMVEALLAMEGCACVSLGTQTPLGDIVLAALAHRADVVALSFSNIHRASVVQASLRELRAQLPDTTALWVGGACSSLYNRPLTGVCAVHQLSDLQTWVAQWRSAH